MPFLEVNDFAGQADGNDARRVAARLMTQAVTQAYSVSPDIVSIYFSGFGDESYAHAGEMPAAATSRRIFIRLHGFSRDVPLRRIAADLITRAAEAAYGIRGKSVAVYFCHRTADEVAHDGQLACD